MVYTHILNHSIAYHGFRSRPEMLFCPQPIMIHIQIIIMYNLMRLHIGITLFDGIRLLMCELRGNGFGVMGLGNGFGVMGWGNGFGIMDWG